MWIKSKNLTNTRSHDLSNHPLLDLLYQAPFAVHVDDNFSDFFEQKQFSQNCLDVADAGVHCPLKIVFSLFVLLIVLADDFAAAFFAGQITIFYSVNSSR